MKGWAYYDDQRGVPCTDGTVCGFVTGPATAPLGAGSAEIATGVSADGRALILQGYQGTRLDALTALSYSTRRQSTDPGNNLAIALQLNVDYDLTDGVNSYQGRLVYEPYQTVGGGVLQDEWRRWDTRDGRWWGTRATVTVGGVSRANPCVQATPCTWSGLLAYFPNVGVHSQYGALVLKAGSGWGAFRGEVDALTIGVSGVLTTYDFELTAAAGVPALPPDSIPSWIYADTNLVDGANVIDGSVAKNALIVAFDPATTLQLRTNAVAAVGGQVIGGMPLGAGIEGVYYLRIDAATPEGVMQAASTLASQPGVALAISAQNDAVGEDYRRPKDGSQARVWQVDASRADGANWALESIGAPFAWGCTTGDASTQIAVIDYDFHDMDDLRDNVVGLTSYNAPIDSAFHGTAVASIVGAVGNNDIGSTGVMWKAGLALYRRDRFGDGLLGSAAQMIRATAAGARVINVSGYLGFPSAVSEIIGRPRRIPRTPVGEAYIDRRVLPVMRWVLRFRNGEPHAPLFVLSAGNGDATHAGQNARYNGFPAIAAEFPSRVLVVAATKAGALHNHLRSDSNFGSLVQIAAPGDSVLALRPRVRLADPDTTVPFAGTSAAAPLVSGVAGLLASYDSSLTVSEIRDFIYAGALLGKKTADGIPYLDAYSALKLAAQRVGAPLCGNRVWNDGNNNILVERGNFQETVISRNTDDYAAYVQAYHGGRRIDVGFSYSYVWDPATRRFQEQPYVDVPFTENSGAWLSYTYVSDHDNTMWAQRSDTSDGAGQQARVKLISNVGKPTIDLGALHVPGTTQSPPGMTCIMEYPVDTTGAPQMYLKPGEFSGAWECMGYGPVGAWDSSPENAPPLGTRNETPILASPAPQGNAVYVPVNVRHISIQWSGLAEGCNQIDVDPTWRAENSAYTIIRRCANKTVDIDSAVRAMVYRIDTATKVWTAIPLAAGGQTSLQNREINSLEVSEDGTEIVISSTRRASYAEFDLNRACHDERLEWISIDQAASPPFAPGTPIKSVDVPQGAACGGWVEAGGTVSPTRIPIQMQMLAPKDSRGSRSKWMYVPLRQAAQRQKSSRAPIVH